MMSSSAFAVSFDMMEVVNRIGADVAMFLVAMSAYWILHYVKRRSAATAKKVGKDIDDFTYQEHTPKVTSAVPPAQCKPCPSCTEASSQPTRPSQLGAANHSRSSPPVCHDAPQHRPAKPAPVENAEPEFSVGEQVALMRKYSAVRNIKDTLGAFHLIQEKGEQATSEMYNILLRAWLNVGNVWAAENVIVDIKEAAVLDESSFVILMKGLLQVKDIEKARDLLQDMQQAGLSPTAASFDALLAGYAREGLFNDGLSLLEEMHKVNAKPNAFTLCALEKLVNSARTPLPSFGLVHSALKPYEKQFSCSSEYPSQVPRLAALMTDALEAGYTGFFHEVEVKGCRSGVMAVGTILKETGFLDKCEQEPSVHQDIHPCVETDEQQDSMCRARFASQLRCLSKAGLGLPDHLEWSVLAFVGSDLYQLRVQYSSDSSRADPFRELSCQFPRLGFRHCCVKPVSFCGQHVLINGEESDEACFRRHINAVSIM